ncbi:MAG: E3 binding domain-containing protein, partial [Solirubrobacteraceae bacterium]|nr:E3 binding domain-containing protein [Solirubrobacteraceae bacterium]
MTEIAIPPRADAGPQAVSASPVARRAARRLGVDLTAVAGSGPHGRILKADVVAAAARPRAVPAQALPAEARPVEAPACALPALALEVEVDLTAATALRDQLAGLADPAPELVHLAAAAAARALRDDATAGVDVGVVTPSGDGVAVVRGADALSVGAIAAAAREASPGTPAIVVLDAGALGVDSAVPVQAPSIPVLALGAVRARSSDAATQPVASLSLASAPGGGGGGGRPRPRGGR